MIVLLLVLNIILTIPLAAPIFLLIVQTTSGTLAADRMFADKIDVGWIIDVFNQQMPGFSLEAIGAQMAALLVVMGLTYLLLNALLSGGIIEVFASDDGLFTMQKFWSGCGRYFWRFFRLMLISLIFYGAAFVIYAVIRRSIANFDEQSTAYQSVVYRRWTAMILLALMCAFVNMVFDYAKIGAAVNNGRFMFRETFKSSRFSWRNFFKTCGLYLTILIIGLAIFALPVWVRSMVDQSSAAAVLLAIMLGQIAIAARVWTRLTFYAAELDLFIRLRPQPAPVIAQTSPSEIEIQSVTGQEEEQPEIVVRDSQAATAAAELTTTAAAESTTTVAAESTEREKRAYEHF
jgi:hypothetical protein